VNVRTEPLHKYYDERCIWSLAITSKLDYQESTTSYSNFGFVEWTTSRHRRKEGATLYAYMDSYGSLFEKMLLPSHEASKVARQRLEL
jgi:hypothetical protein